MKHVMIYLALVALPVAFYIYMLFKKGVRANCVFIEHKVIFDKERGNWIVDEVYGFDSLVEAERFLDTLDN